MNVLLTALFVLASGFGYAAHSILAPEPQLSAALPQAVAVFETSLQSPITSSATSMTLTANAVRGGGALSGYNCFAIDEGSAQAEFVCGTVSSTAVTAMLRGISPLTGTTTDTDLQFAHRRGANVKITDFPLIQIMKAQLNGEDTFPNLLTYANTVLIGAGTPTTTLATKYYVDSVAVAGASNADTSTKGIVEEGTASEIASSTQNGGTGARLFIPGSMATDTPNTATRASRVLMSDMTGYLTQGWLNLTEHFSLSNASIASTSMTRATTTSAFALLSGILHINGVNYRWPSSIAATSTVLSTDASGNLLWLKPPVSILYSNSAPLTGQSTTTVTIPANTLVGANKVRVSVAGVGTGGGGTASIKVKIGSGSSTTTINGTANSSAIIQFEVVPTGASSQIATSHINGTYSYLSMSLANNAPIYIGCVTVPTDGSAIIDECLVELISSN